VVWDRRTGEPIHNAIVPQDRRTATFCDELRRAGHADLIQHRAGLMIDAYFAGSKLHWILDHVPGPRERARRGELALGTIDTWLSRNQLMTTVAWQAGGQTDFALEGSVFIGGAVVA